MRSIWLLASSVLIVPGLAHAQSIPPSIPAPAPSPVPAEEQPTSGAPDTTASDASGDDADLAEINAALGADAATAAADAPPPPAAATQSMNPDISVILDVAGAWFSEDTNLQAGDHDPTGNGFNLQQVELSMGKAVDPYFRLDTNIVFGAEGAEVEEAYATTLALPHNLQARAGQFLTRFGRLNPTHPHSWDFVDQPFALSRIFGGEGNRGAGAELSYLTPLPWYVELIGSVTDPRGEGTARSFLGASDQAVDSPADLQTTLVAKQFFEIDDDTSLMWGVSWATGANGSGDGKRTNVVGTDLYLKYRPITTASDTVIALQSEWLYRRRQVPGGVDVDVDGYLQLMWKFARRWGTAARYEYGSAQDGGDQLDSWWTAARHRGAADLTFWPTEFSRLRLQGSVDAPGWLDSPTWAGFLALEVSMGVHGAHKF